MNVGRPQSQSRRQLFRFSKPKQSVLVADSLGVVYKITMSGAYAFPTMQRATEAEVADYVLGYVRRHGDGNRPTQGWVWHILQDLGCQKHMDEFAKIFPDHQVKVRG